MQQQCLHAGRGCGCAPPGTLCVGKPDLPHPPSHAFAFPHISDPLISYLSLRRLFSFPVLLVLPGAAGPPEHLIGGSEDLGSALRQRIDPQTGEVLFTMDQVRDIVRRAVDEKERALREQYDHILQQKLNEQFQSFAKFNEDYISRSLKTSDLSYCS